MHVLDKHKNAVIEHYATAWEEYFGITSKINKECIRKLLGKVIDDAQAPLKEVLLNVVNSAVHPETDYRAVMVDLKPIRKLLNMK